MMRLAALLAILAGLWIAAPASAQPGELRTLQPDRLPGMCITLVGAAAEAVSLPCDGSDAEKFLMPGAEGGPIHFAARCLVPVGEGNYPPLAAATCDGSPEQTWKMSAAGELRSAAGRCISLLGSSSRTGELIFAGECPTSGEGQPWRARMVDVTNVVEASLESVARPGQCIGYGARLALYSCTDAYQQVISLDEKSPGQLRMMSSCLSGGYVLGALSLGECWDMPQQKWLILEDGRVTNQSKECIEVSNEDGRDVLRTRACATMLEQRWRVRRPPVVETSGPQPAVGDAAAAAHVDPAPTVEEPSISTASAEDVAPATTDAPAVPSVTDVAVTDTSAAAPEILVTSIATPVAPPATEAPPAVDVAAAVAVEPAPKPVLVDPIATAAAEPAASAATTPPETAAVIPAYAPIATVTTPIPPMTLAMTLQHEQLPGMCMSLSGRDGESESQPCDGAAIQTFELPVGAPGSIRNGDRCLAPRGKGTYQQLVAVACDGKPEQTWIIRAEGEIRNATGRCLSLLGNSSRSGERVYAGECPAGLPAHHWRAVAVDPAHLHPVSGMLESIGRPGKCLGTDGALGLVSCDARLGRIFSFDATSPSQFRMMSSCLASGFIANSLALGQCWNMPSQKWTLTSAANLYNLDGKCIVVGIEDGHDVLRSGACLPVPEQQWTLREVAP